MGRKPDVIISTYFDRGIKLPDSSNRYSFTCKGCGATFPKGRTTHLLDHLIGNISRCPTLTAGDVASILAVQASKSTDKAQHVLNKRSAPYGFLDQDLPSSGWREPKRQSLHMHGTTTSLSGLEALAEASRRAERPFDTPGYDSFVYDEIPAIDPNLNSTIVFPDILHAMSSDPSTIVAANVFEESAPSSHGQSTSDNNSIVARTASRTSPLENLAEQLVEAANFPVLIAANPSSGFAQDSHGLNTGKVSKSRSKFSEARREEVRGVRSKRACIRCRMLRKPVSISM